MARVYVFDKASGAELSQHPANDSHWLATSGNVYRDGKFIGGTCTSFTVADHASLRHVSNERTYTADDFDREIVVKIWYGPSSPHNDRRTLCKGD